MTSEPGLPASTDVVIIGSGAAALAAAIAARVNGLDVIILEKDRCFGGTTALSGAAMYLPLSAQSQAAGVKDSREQVLRYLDDVVGNAAPRDLRAAFVDHAAEALAFFEAHSELAYDLRPVSPDYHPEKMGAVDGGRVLDVRQYDGRRLGRHFRDLRPPLPTHLVLGGMMVNRQDVQLLLQVGRSWAATAHVLKLVARYVVDRLRYGRGTRLVLGSALVARLAATVFDLGIPLFRSCPAEELIHDAEGGVAGVIATPEGHSPQRVVARHGVVLATGGFAANNAMSAANRQGNVAPHYSMVPRSCAGDGIRLGVSAGGVFGEPRAGAFFWAPVSVKREADGTLRRFAHLTLDRAKPGIVAVDRNGRRFTNEADSYHRFGEALQALLGKTPSDPPAWLICDARALRAYGLGMARPFPAHGGNRALVAAGYLVEAPTLADLAKRLRVPEEIFSATVASHNAFAERGVDEDFCKGASRHNRVLGDSANGPNPCLAPIDRAPFYAVAVHSGDLGTARGLVTDSRARVLGPSGMPVPGLYAVGNDMHSIMGGMYPGPGITLGPALVFAYLAASDIARHAGLPLPAAHHQAA